MKQFFILIFLCFLSVPSQAGLLKDFDSLGGNDALMTRAKALQPDKDVQIVQDRTVSRRWRNELSGGYTNVVGGDSFLQTQMLSLDYHLHINPYWSVGLGYFSAFNKKSSESQYLIYQNKLVPDMDAPDTGYEVLGNFSPIYGKLNLFNMGVVQFDVYAIGSYGKIKLQSGETSTYTWGAGFGLWLSQYMTTRFELRQRYYQAQRFGGPSDIETTNVNLSLGFML